MSDQKRQADFFWQIFLPVVLLVFTLFGLPWLAMKWTAQRDLPAHVEPLNPASPAPNNPSPPASGTGPPVAGDGGETG